MSQAKSADEKKEAESKAKVLEDQIKEQKRLLNRQNLRIEAAAEEARKTAEEAKTTAD